MTETVSVLTLVVVLAVELNRQLKTSAICDSHIRIFLDEDLSQSIRINKGPVYCMYVGLPVVQKTQCSSMF